MAKIWEQENNRSKQDGQIWEQENKRSKQDGQNLGARKQKGLNRMANIWAILFRSFVFLLPDFGHPV
jgi:hypothetical protein